MRKAEAKAEIEVELNLNLSLDLVEALLQWAFLSSRQGKSRSVKYLTSSTKHPSSACFIFALSSIPE